MLAISGCGSSPASSDGPRASARTLDDLAARAQTTVPIAAGTGDLAPGRVRYTFLVVAPDGRTIERPRATVWLARGRDQTPTRRAVATLEPMGVAGASDRLDTQAQYVAQLDVPAPGTYWLLARPDGSRIAAIGQLIVKTAAASPAVGAVAPRSDTPTLAASGGRLAPLTTAPKPDRRLYEHSVAASLRANVPFVVAFATPAFCASRTCGPVVEVVSRVRRTLPPSRARFIHVEVYEQNDPSRGYNRWMEEWRLESEPWVFLVGADGRIAAKFEGAVSVRELRAAVRRHLMR